MFLNDIYTSDITRKVRQVLDKSQLILIES